MILSENKRITKIAVAIFAAAEIILGVIIQMPNVNSEPFSFASVVLAFLFSLLMFNKSADWALTAAALLFTVCADYCLVIMPSEPRVLAMVFFNTTQILYFVRLFIEQNKKTKIANISLRIALITVILTASFILLGKNNDTLSVIALIYFANLLSNIVFAFVGHKRFLLFAVGLLLFSFCDIFVGFNVLVDVYIESTDNVILNFLAHPGFNFIWFFYVPSQTLISITAKKGGKRKTESS